MKKALIWIAASLMMLGMTLFTVVLFMVNFDFTKLNNMKYTTNTYEFSEEPFGHIDINTITSDIEFRKSDDGNCRVVCYESQKLRHEVTIQDNTLTISEKDTRTWTDHITVFNFNSPSITIYLPLDTYEKLNIDNTTGDIHLSGNWNFSEIKLATTTGDVYVNGIATTGDVSVHVSTGKIKLENITCKNLTTDGSTGDTTITDVFAESMRMKRTTGDITLESCDAGTLYLRATTGDITATLKTDKTVIASATTGDVNVPHNTTGGRCEVSTTTGDIHIRIKN